MNRFYFRDKLFAKILSAIEISSGCVIFIFDGLPSEIATVLPRNLKTADASVITAFSSSVSEYNNSQNSCIIKV